MEYIKKLFQIQNLSKKQFFNCFVVYTVITSVILYLNFSSLTKTIIFLLNYIFILGILIADNMGLRIRDFNINTFVYSVGFAIGSHIFIGLLLNFALGKYGILEPLNPVYLLFTYGVVLTALLYRSLFYKSLELWDLVFLPIPFKRVLPVIFPIISVLGVFYLENTNHNYILLPLVFLIVITFIYYFFSEEEVTTSEYSSLIFFSGLALLLTFSMRGAGVLGWDINEEFQVFVKTLENLRWSMAFYPGLDYNSCISITILPTIIKVLTGIKAEYVFKFFMQVLFAFVPVSVFAISRQFIYEKYAYLSSMVFIFNVWFFEQMPAIIRQEIAFIFLSVNARTSSE